MTTIASTYQFAGGETWEADNLNNNVNTPLEDLLGRNGLKFREASLLVLPGPGDRYLLLPVGTTAQRPTSPAVGYVRFNSSVSKLEWYNGSDWRPEPTIAQVVTFASLNANGDVGVNATQVSFGNHGH